MSDFARAAVLGTEQAPSSADVTGTPVDALVSSIDGLDRERAFILRAGSLALIRRAGKILTKTARTVAPAPAETLRRASENLATLLLPLFLSESDADLLEEALDRLSAARLRLPEELLPLALSARSSALKKRIPPVLGERGRWLAEMRPEWAWALSSPNPAREPPANWRERWSEGTAEERAQLLAWLRRTSPDEARQIVAESWKQEKAEQRLAWLEIAQTTLSEADEPWLSSALSDRSGQVRLLAARTLWRLPTSELAARMHRQVDALLAPNPKPSLSLPADDFDPAWEKSGIVEAPPQGMGRRQWWLAQMLSAVPPDHLSRRIGTTPERFVETFLEQDLGPVVIDGVTSASLRFDARAWFAPLWDAWIWLDAGGALSPAPLSALTARLAPEDLEPRVLTALESPQRGELLAHLPRPWPPRLAHAFLDQLKTIQPNWTQLLPIAGLSLPIELVPDLLPVPEAGDDYATHVYLRAFDRFQSTLATRRAIAKEIAT